VIVDLPSDIQNQVSPIENRRSNMTLKPWYQVVYPREDLRENRPLDAAEFAVHLDQVRDGRAPGDYQDPARFFARTYLTTSLTDLAGQVLRRLSGERTEASAVFNLSTQFGGGKTHALTLLYHLGRHGQAARDWQGVGRLLRKAAVERIPQAATAVFVGTEFDSLRGRARGAVHRAERRRHPGIYAYGPARPDPGGRGDQLRQHLSDPGLP
jgi:hypothetical protein